MDFGKPAAAANATRTINVVMKDNLYQPETISVQAGETIRFVISNKGEFVHEFNIGTPAMHAKHQEEMMMMVEHGALEPDKINRDKMKMDMGNGKTMEHNDPNSTLLEPGQSAEIVWTFTKAGNLEFACNVPGHYDAGMVGKLSVKPKSS
ncbi:cupredoxin family protein [Thalassobaculum sp.]|uniref:cupredoxin domain-containing protein n=1 Tax=Thalassobaculum sp. TaxID=2022740 RepID=UPI0032ED3624